MLLYAIQMDIKAQKKSCFSRFSIIRIILDKGKVIPWNLKRLQKINLILIINFTNVYNVKEKAGQEWVRLRHEKFLTFLFLV